MPTKRTRQTRGRIRGPMPPGVQWWLTHGYSLSIGESRALGMTERDAWIASNLHFARAIVTGWTRRDLRELGYGAQIDAHVVAGRCPPDRR